MKIYKFILFIASFFLLLANAKGQKKHTYHTHDSTNCVNTFKWSDRLLSVGAKRVIDVHFDLDRANLSDSNNVMGIDKEADRYNTLLFDTLINFLEQNPQLKISIDYHSDQDYKTYIKTHSRIIGPTRAKSIVNYLIKHGIDSARVENKYIGDIKPVYMSYPKSPKEHGPIGYRPTHRTELVIVRTDSSFAPEGTFNWMDKYFTVGDKRRVEVRYCLDKACIEDSNPALDTTAKFMKANPNLKIGIYVHTDQQGSEQHNLPLSNVRAHTIVNYLRYKNGIDSARLVPQGFGFTQPIIPLSVILKEKNKLKRDSLYHINRRTEIVILDTAYKKEIK
jgi:outer membrane protein OmpA-like peptidoglycan-associated protein